MKAEDLRWFVETDDGPVYLVPQNRYTFKGKTKAEQQFYRLELAAGLTFGGKKRPQDYAYLMAINSSRVARYEKHIIVFEVKLSGVWREKWRGEFTGNDMDPINECDCTVTMKPKVLDDYSCILDNYDKEFNIIEAGPVQTVKAPRFLPYEFQHCRPAANCVPGGEGWAEFFENTDDDDVRVYWREYRIVPCVGGTPQPPDDDPGWILIDDNCATDGTAKYAREPDPLVIPPDVAMGHCMRTVEMPPPNPQELVVSTPDLGDDPPVIQGPVAVYRQSILQQLNDLTYTIKHPRSGSTYTWAFSAGVTIVSGQGTSEIILRISALVSVTSIDVDCTESTSCDGDVVASTFTSSVFTGIQWVGTNVNSSLLASDMFAPLECRTGDYLEVTLPFSVPGKGTRWEAIDATVVSFTNRKAVLYITSANDPQVRFGYQSSDLFDPIWSPYLTIDRVNAPASDPIQGPVNVCTLDEVTYYIPMKSSVVDVWDFPDGWSVIESGPGYRKVRVGPTGGTVYCAQTMDTAADLILIAPCGPFGQPPWYWAFDDQDFSEYETGRYLSDVFDWIINKTCELPEGTAPIKSDFLQIRPDEPTDTNYVTGERNRLKHLTIHSKGDVLHPQYNEMTRILKFKLKELLHIVCTMFNARWVMESGTIRIEHVSWFDDVELVDISAAFPSCQWKYEKGELDRSEHYKFMEAANADFLGLPIYYDLQGPEPRTKHPGVADESKNIPVNDVSTDLPFIEQATDDEVERTGIVILQNRITPDGDLWVEEDEGKLTTMVIPNAHLGWANLHHFYFMHDRALPIGYINNQFKEFLSVKPILKEDGAFGMCAQDLFDFDPAKRYTTKRGPSGKVTEYELDFLNENIKLKLAHQP